MNGPLSELDRASTPSALDTGYATGPVARTGRLRLIRVVAAHLALTVIVLAPVFSVAVPGLGDTLNHLARMHILATIGHSPALQRFYEVHWSPIPYLAMDAVVPPLLRLFPIYFAGKLFTAACMVLPVWGTVAVHYVVHRRASLVPCAAYLCATNALLSFGFLNFLFSAGLALLLFAGWIAAGGWPRWRRAALFAPCVLVLYFGHAFACGAYCLAIFGLEAGRAIRARFRPATSVLADLAAAFVQAVPALYFAATLNVAAGYTGPLRRHYGSIEEKLGAAISPFMYLHDAVYFAALLCAVSLALILSKRLWFDGVLWPAALAVGLTALAVPHVLASTWGTDLRLPLVTVLLVIAALSVRIGRVGRTIVMAGFIAMVAFRSFDAWSALRSVDTQFAEMRSVLASLPRGSRLLSVTLDLHNTGRERVPINTQWHLPMVATIERDAFLPLLFTGLTTVRVRQPYRAASTPNGFPILPEQLRAGAVLDDDGVERGDGEGARLYYFGWPHKFDYVLVYDFGADPGPLPPNLTLRARTRNIALYEIRRESGPPHSN